MRAKVGIAIFAALTVTLFTMAAVHNNDLFWGDVTILSALRVDDKTWQQFFARFDTTPNLSLGFVLVVSAALWLGKKKLEAVAYLLLLPALLLTVSFPKIFVKRLRPEGALEGMTNSFPSGTATVSVLVLGFLIFLVGEFVGPRNLRIGIQVALGVVITLLGVFRLLAGEHWPSDIVGGYMAGAMALIAVIWLYRKLRKIQFRPGQAKPQPSVGQNPAD
ncbi:MAG: phosphatase PAP2 family protein [Chloroflexi bacterium]|nr:phosphatase PAP2 family protein [Chloroflexota bacterium]